MQEFQAQSLILRDQLAMARTHMANERTFMAYIRTSLMLFASGATLIKIYENTALLQIFGWILLPIALSIAVFSVFRFFRTRCRINRDCQITAAN